MKEKSRSIWAASAKGECVRPCCADSSAHAVCVAGWDAHWVSR